ncbi:MAG: L,D-transpeptidase family protein [Gammaproteobacteria bacterium]|nr:L,D-transpeptidase family protein [Gammaproteobacteria bacterium]
MKKRFIAYPLIILSIFLFYQYGRSLWYPVAIKFMGKKTVEEVISQYGDQTRNKLSRLFEKEGISYPPKNLALIAFKDVSLLEIWGANEDKVFKKITQYPVLAASGELGPKLVEGDRQVPEGVYKIIGFNPNSSYHVSMKLNYPNEFDLKHAKAEGRENPGTNIFIHGRDASIGCLAMGDPAIEDLFTLVYKTGRSNTQVIISPTNPSIAKLTVPTGAPAWTKDLYTIIESSYRNVTEKHNQ